VSGYTPRGGTVDVEASTDDGGFTLRVFNTVENLDERDLPHLFERFWRKDPARSTPEHCGLGLAVSKAFARQLRCCMDASLKGNTTLVITLSSLET
jgi:signal transduction histidine kinase